MSLLGKYTDNFIEDDELDEKSGYVTPAVLKDDEDISLKKSIMISAILHPTAIGVWALIVLILSLMGITFKIFEKPKPKVNDIEFVLVDKEETPINKKTPYRADINSRAGGHHDPKRKVSMPSPSPGAPKQASKSANKQAAQKPAQQKNPLQKIVKQVTQQAQAPAPKKSVQQPSSGPIKPQQAKPAPPTARPSLKPPTTPRPTAKPSSAFTVPVPKGGTGSGRYTTGPISGSGTSAKGGGAGGSSSNGSGKYAPAPSLAPTGGSGSKLAKGGGGGTGGYGNPGPGNPNGRPGIDAIREPDFGPYMRELQRRIKMNWDPPKGNESKRVVLLFKIAKDGRLLSCSVFKSSGLPGADKAAINAVQATAPFRPLPAEFKGQSIDIQFTFDYNVFGASGY
jgi:tonB family C-terminal domain